MDLPPRPGLTIFDCDGVLVDTEPITLRVMTEWLGVCGLTIDLAEVTRAYKGTDLAEIKGDVERRLGGPIDPGVGDFAAGYRDRMFRAFEAGVPPLRGAAELLERMTSARAAWCVASNGPREKMAVSLKAAGLGRFFAQDSTQAAAAPEMSPRVFSAYDIGRWKPEPDLFLHAIERMGADRASAVVVEDSISGVVAARRGGIRCIALADITPAEDLVASGANAVARTMDEVAALLGFPTP